jgi:PAS domain S-box-containing protein
MKPIQPDKSLRQRAEKGLRPGGGLTSTMASARQRDEEAVRYQNAALEAAANPVVIADPSGNIQWVNAAFTALTGYTSEEVLGRNPRLLKSGRQDEAFYRNLWQAISSGQVWRGELTNRRKDGSFYSEEMTITPVRSADGAVARYVAIKQDISQRRQAEEKLKLFRTLIERSSDAIHVVDSANGRFLDVNESACQALGYTRDELLALTLFEVLPQVERATFEASNARIEEKGHDTLEALHRRKDGTTYLGETSLSFVALDRKYLVAIVRDITGRKKLEFEMENLHKKLVEASRLAGMAEIASNVLHNVGNALNSVNISTELIVDSVRNSKASSLAKIVILLEEHAHHLGEFITHDPRGSHVPAILARLSEHLMAEQAKITVELESLRQNLEHIKEIVAMQQSYTMILGAKEVVNVTGLVEDSLRLNEGAFNRHGLEVVREFEEVAPINVEKYKILQILVNLVRNAKYACDESGRADRRLTMRVANGDGTFKITVLDNGIGIPPENLTRIFDYGFTTRKGGHGIGLHGSALAAKEMGGSLTVQSGGPGQGAAFTLELPCPKGDNSHEDSA